LSVPLLFVATSRRPLSAFAHWYALALGLIATGLFGVTVQSSSASLLGWVGHTAAYLGGLCLLVAAVASVRESRVWGMSLQASLRESEEKFRAMADTSQAAISLYQDGHVIYANHASEFVFGYSLDERRGMDFLELLHPDFRQRAGERMKAILTNEFGDAWVPCLRLGVGMSGSWNMACLRGVDMAPRHR
jgi:PAS domain-containing protein